MVKVPGNKTKMHVGFTYSKHPQYFNILNRFSISNRQVQVVAWKQLILVLSVFHWPCFLYYALFISHYPAGEHGHAILDESSVSSLMEEIIFQRHGGRDLFVS